MIFNFDTKQARPKIFHADPPGAGVRITVISLHRTLETTSTGRLLATGRRSFPLTRNNSRRRLRPQGLPPPER